MDSEDRINGNGRKTYSFSLKPNIIRDFTNLCNKHGFALSKRIEILLLKDIDKNAGFSKSNAPLGEIKGTKE